MNADLKNFVTAYLRIVLIALVPIALAAFLTIPYSLGGHPGEPLAQTTEAPRHLT